MYLVLSFQDNGRTVGLFSFLLTASISRNGLVM